MSFDLYLSYSGRKTYIECPKQYEYKYVNKEIVDRDPRDALFGSIIGKVFEWFYEKRVWASADPVSATLALCEPAITHIFHKEKWDENFDTAFVHQLRGDLRHFVPKHIDVIRANGFLTPFSRAEVDLTVTYTSALHGLTLKLGGRCDFIHAKDPLDVWITDGKASKHREKYVDAEQLIWYGIQHYIKYRVAPSRLGFVFFKFPEDPVKWIDYDEESMRKSVAHTFDVGKRILLKMFPATPSDHCKLCDYGGRCEEGLKYKAAKRVEEGSRIDSSIFDLEQM